MAKCEFPNCVFSAVTGKYCHRHKAVMGEKTQAKEQQPIAKRSDKMTSEMKEYKKEVQLFLAKTENHKCAIQSPVCKGKAVAVNHKRRRGKNLRNQKHWEPCCAPCNTYIEQFSEWAYENGHLEKVHQLEK